MKFSHIVKTLAKSLREYKKATILTPIFIIVECLMECIIPLVISRFINTLESFQTSANLDSKELLTQITIYGLILLALAFISLFGGTMAAKYGSIAGAGFAKNLRKDLYYHIQEFSFENIDKFSTSSLVTRLTTDVMWVQQSFTMLIRLAVRAPLMLIFSIALSFTYHKTLPLVFLIVVPILAIGLYIIMSKSHPIFEKVFNEYDDLNNNVQENIRGMRVVKAYVREDYEMKKFDDSSRKIEKDFVKAEKIMAFMTPLMMFSIYICMTLITIIGSAIIVKTTSIGLTLGALTGLTTYTVQILSSLMMFSFVLLMVIISMESAVRICEVLEEKPSIVNPDNAIKDVNNGDIDFKNVSFKYSKTAEKYALKNIDLHIKSGQTVGIIGGTGSSKSTLIQLISRLYDTSEGDVYVADHNVKEYDLVSLRDAVAVVLQKNVLFKGTIKENLRWGNPNATDEELKEACELSQADEFIQTFKDKYDTHIDQGGNNVSGGQKQRLCIARALLKKPRILILDDSTSAVDTKTDALIRKGFKEYIPETTKIIIAQRISSVQDADMIVVMDNGEINAIGKHDELLASNAIYQEVYYSQNKLEADKKAGDYNG